MCEACGPIPRDVLREGLAAVALILERQSHHGCAEYVHRAIAELTAKAFTHGDAALLRDVVRTYLAGDELEEWGLHLAERIDQHAPDDATPALREGTRAEEVSDA